MMEWNSGLERMWAARFEVLDSHKPAAFYEFIHAMAHTEALYALRLAVAEIKRLRKKYEQH
jgi:hypothetical protein